MGCVHRRNTSGYKQEHCKELGVLCTTSSGVVWTLKGSDSESVYIGVLFLLCMSLQWQFGIVCVTSMVFVLPVVPTLSNTAS